MALHHRIVEHATSSQSHLIVAAVLLAFIVWVTLRGNLGKYLNALGIGKNPVVAQVATGAGAGAVGGGIGGAAQGALQGLGGLGGLGGVGTPPFNPNPTN